MKIRELPFSGLSISTIRSLQQEVDKSICSILIGPLGR
ncbi:MAG: hypothetical protein ACI9NY_001711, partial [Kiritimatiellia bacterium]